MELGENVQSATLEITIVRKDGTVEKLGVVDEFHRSELDPPGPAPKGD